MDPQDVGARLRALATDDNSRTKAARLSDVLDDVEHAMQAGVSQARIVEVLRAAGLEMSVATFSGTLRRLRAKRAKRPSPPARASEPPSPTPPAPQSSHRPESLNAIFGSQPDLDSLSKLGKKS